MLKVIYPSGILDSVNGNQFRTEIRAVIATGVKTVLVDCQDVQIIDSSGLGALVMALRMLQSAGGTLALCSLNAQLKLVLELTGMDDVFAVFADQAAFYQAHPMVAPSLQAAPAPVEVSN